MQKYEKRYFITLYDLYNISILFIKMLRIFQRVKFLVSNSKKDTTLYLESRFLEIKKKCTPEMSINFLYALQKNKQDMKKPLENDQIYEIYQTISPQLYKLQHVYLQKLLYVMKMRNEYYIPNKNICRNISYCFKNSLYSKFNIDLTYSTFTLLDKLNYPHKIISLQLQHLCKQSAILNLKPKITKFTPINLIKTFIFVLQKQYIQIIFVKKFLSVMKLQKIDKIRELALMYHVTQIIEGALKRKISYHQKYSSSKDIMLDPFTSASKEVQQVQLQYSSEYKQFLNNKTLVLQTAYAQTMLQFQKIVSQDVLQMSIVNSINSGIEVISKEDLLLLTEMKRLMPYFNQYVGKNYATMTPIQFIAFNKSAMPENFIPNYQKYWHEMKQYMDVEDKVYLFLEANRYAKIPIRKQNILQVIEQIQTINKADFLGIVKMIQQIHQGDRQYLTEIIEKLNNVIDK